MAATAEALMNTLAGGSDAGSEPSTETAVVEAVGQPVEPGEAPPDDVRTVEGGTPPDGGPAAKPTPEQLYQNAQAAIRETRAENKTLKQHLAELNAKIESLAKPAAAETPPEEPDFLADPKGYVDDTRKQIKDLTEKLESKEKQQTEAQQKAQEAQETWNKVLSAEAEFSKTAPDYQDALQHIRTVTTQQIKLQYPQATDEQIARHIQQQEFQGAAQIVADGRNPSQVYYEYAKLIGYKAKAADPAPTPAVPKPDKDAVRTMGSGGAADSGGGDENSSDGALGGLLAVAQNEHRAQFKNRGRKA